MITAAMQRRFLLFLASSAVFVSLVLALDRDGLLWQLALGGGTAAFLVFWARRAQTEGAQVVCAVAIATLGEAVLSLAWGLYSYRHALIPLYVPPGHGVMYLLAAETARQPSLRRHAEAIARAVLVAGSAVAAASLIAWSDVWGLLWWLAALALLRVSRNRLLLSSCFVYTMLLEWLGTAAGNWRWEPIVPLVGLRSANPPAGVGILYVLLDLLVVVLTNPLRRLTVSVD
jgi:hypothetical protein